MHVKYNICGIGARAFLIHPLQMHCSACLIAAGQHVHCATLYKEQIWYTGHTSQRRCQLAPRRHARQNTGLRLALIHKTCNREIIQGQVLKKEKDSVTRGALFADAAAPLQCPCEYRTPYELSGSQPCTVQLPIFSRHPR